MLNIEHLTKTYGGKAAVQDLSLHIRPGDLRIHRPQRRGQDHHTQVLLRHPAVRQRPHYGGRYLGAG